MTFPTAKEAERGGGNCLKIKWATTTIRAENCVEFENNHALTAAAGGRRQSISISVFASKSMGCAQGNGAAE